MLKKVISNTTNLDVATNEYATKWSAQRVFNRLLQNDKSLEEFYNQILGNVQIFQYQYGDQYKYNDVVWFLDSSFDLHILRFNKNSIQSVDPDFQNLNRWDPNGTIPFEKYGWKDLNPDIDILKDFGLDKAITTYITRRFKQHQDDDSKHPFGRLSWKEGSQNHIETKIARNDLANINPNRESMFFPYHTFYLEPKEDDSVLAGQCRWYDNGLLEYDLIFRLSYFGYKLVDEEYNEYADILSANVLDLSQSRSDEDYFMSYNDATIFSPKGMQTYQSTIGETYQQNRNDVMNVYSAKIDFSSLVKNNDEGLPVQFAQTKQKANYMIFCSDIMCQDRDLRNGSLNISQNSMCFCQKLPGSFCAFLVTYGPLNNSGKKGFNAANGGLQANSFHCKLVGRHI